MPIPAWLGGVAAGAMGFFGQERANSANRREAEKNRQFQAGEANTNRLFQERMRNTEWQAAIADMQAAGINPALAYARGGASSPGGSIAGGSQAAPAGDSVSSAMQQIMMKQQRDMTATMIRKTEAEAQAAGAIATREKARNLGYGISEQPDGSMKIDYSLPGLVQETQAMVRLKIAEAARGDSMARIAGIGGQVAQGFGQAMPAFESIMGVVGKGADGIADVINILERAARMRDSAVQSAFGMSKEALQRLLTSLKQRRN